MTITKLFIADTDVSHIQRIREVVARQSDMALVGWSSNGTEALKQLTRTNVDLLLTDVQLPGEDGLLLIKDLTRLGRCPPTIVCTQFYSSRCVDMLCRVGVSYISYKPMDYSRLPNLIRDCLDAQRRAIRAAPMRQEPPEQGWMTATHGQLQAMGLPTMLTGTQYLSCAMKLLGRENDLTLMQNLSKGLYARVAEQLESTPARVERSIRTAIAVGYERGVMRERFGHRPSNREFIRYLYNAVIEEVSK